MFKVLFSLSSDTIGVVHDISYHTSRSLVIISVDPLFVLCDTTYENRYNNQNFVCDSFRDYFILNVIQHRSTALAIAA